MLAGPLDMCNGFMTLTDLEKQRPKVFKPVNSTVVGEAARILITFSGLAYLPDTPESYESKADLFEFIAQLPMTWDETKILNGEIGKHITTARRVGRNWYIASCANEAGAELSIDLNFLEPGVTYAATLYEDTPETHFETNKESYRIRKITLKKGDIFTAKIAPGGGHCMTLIPLNGKDI
jgi:alpha-glucosidase